MDASSGYQTLQLDKRMIPDNIHMSISQIQICKITITKENRWKIKELSNVFGTTGDISCKIQLRQHSQWWDIKESTEISRQETLKLNTDKCHFRCKCIPFFSEKVCRCGLPAVPYKLHMLIEMSPPKSKKESMDVGKNHTRASMTKNDVLWWIWTTIFRNWHIQINPGCRTITSKKRNDLPKTHGMRQLHMRTNSIYKQGHRKCGNMIQQYRWRSTKHIP